MNLKQIIKKRVLEATALSKTVFVNGEYANVPLNEIPEDYLINYLINKGRQMSTADLTYAVQKNLIDRGVVHDIATVNLKTLDPIDIIVYFLCHVDLPKKAISKENEQAAQRVLDNLDFWFDLTEKMPFKSAKGKSYLQATKNHLNGIMRLVQKGKPPLKRLLILFPQRFFEQDRYYVMLAHAIKKRKGEKDAPLKGEYLDGGIKSEHNVIFRVSNVVEKEIKGKNWRIISGQTRQGEMVMFFSHISNYETKDVRKGQLKGFRGRVFNYRQFDDQKVTLLDYLSQFMVRR